MDHLLRRLLEPRIGHVLSPWPSQVYRAVERLARAEDTSPEDFLWRLLAFPDDTKINLILGSATISHTAFFRHPEQFDYLRTTALRRMAEQAGGVVRVWSAGCATGEEPYSLAMAARDAGVEMQILATDVNPVSLEVARAGVYDPRRAGSLPECDPVRGWSASADLRSCIRFERSSLTGPDPALGLAPFDIVFCRNVLVYFDQQAASRIIDTLLSKLKRRGALVVAPVEGVMRVPRARPAEAPLGWFSATAPPAPTVPLTRRPPPLRRSESQRLPAAPVPAAPAAPPAREEPSALPIPTEPLEEAARRLGAGDRDGAEETLRQLLDADPANAEAWFLLGETFLQRGERTQARIAFNRAADCAVGEGSAVEAETLLRAAKRRADMC